MTETQWEYKTAKLTIPGHYLQDFYWIRTDGQKVQYRADVEVDRPESKDYLEWVAYTNSLVEGMVEAQMNISAGVDEYESAHIDITITGWKDLTVDDFPELEGKEIVFKTITYSFS